LNKRKKILRILVKILIGVGSFLVIYFRLRSDFTPDKTEILYNEAFSLHGMLAFTGCVLLIPVNWGIEAWKWRLITKPIEPVSYRTATKSVYAGVFLGNLAPGRATEFLARIIYFHIENRPRITVLHFVNGLFQLSITVLAGFLALIFKVRDFGEEYDWMLYTITGLGVIFLAALVLSVWRIESILAYFSRKINKDNAKEEFEYRFTAKSVFRLFWLSAERYAVFYIQFVLLLMMFRVDVFQLSVLAGVALYFLVTTAIPMISVLEAAIRAAVALVVFSGAGISNSVLALSSVLIWIANIIIPSIPGYYFLVRKNFNFKLFGRRK
jgi:hypothetical protein